MNNNQRPRLQRSASERGTLQRSSSLFGLLGRVPWPTNDDDHYSSSGEDEQYPVAPPSPVVSQEEAKRARKQKLQRLFKQGVSRVVRERAEEMDLMAKKGSLYVMDAFAGRLQHGMAAMSTKPWYIFMAFRLQISAYWMWTIIASSVAHSLLVFLEPRPGRPPEDGVLGPGTLLGLEAAFITVYALDVALKASYMGLKSYVKKPWQKLMVVIVLLLAIDASGVVGVRFARALRPAILSVRTRHIRRFYAVVSQMLPGFLRVCLPVVFFLLLSASYAALSFGRAKSDFEDPSTAGYAIWILMVCADNYEALVNDRSTHPAYVPFIVMVIVVGSMFLLSLLLGVTYDVFIEHTTEQVNQERMKELKGLNVAFATMDPTGTGKLSMVVWERFLLHLMPRTTQQERALYFEIASSFADNLDVLGFMDLRQVLSYSFVNVNAVERQGKRKKWEKMPPRVAWLLEKMEAVLATRWWKHTVAAVVLLDCLILPHSIPHQGPGLMVTRLTMACGAVLLLDQAFQLAEWMHQGAGPGPLKLSGGKSLHTKVAGVGVILHTLVVALLHCPPLLSLVCSLVSFTWDAFSSDSGSLPSEFSGGGGGGGGGGPEFSVVEAEGLGAAGGAWEGEICGLDEGVYGGESGLGVFEGGGGRERMCMEVDWCTDSLLMLAYTLRLVRCWRLVTLSDTLHDHVNTFFSVVPVFAQTLSFALIIAYAFAMVAMQAFADKATAFSDAGMSLRTTLQLFVGVDFSAVVEETVNEVGHKALLFFVAYHVVGVLIVFNLLTAIMIQLYGEALNEKSRQGVEEQRKADQDLQDSLYEYNQKQRVLRLWGKRVTQGAASLNITRETKVNNGREARRMLGAAGTKSQALTVEELEECQKYAKVDLLRTLRERSRADNNLRMFERSFYKKIKSATGPEAFNFEEFADGEIIYHRGDQHSTCYFVHKGVVRLEWADGTIETKETGEMFGEEALVVNLATTATAIAEGPVSCVGMDRAKFTEEHGTLENLGMVFLRLQRSGSFYRADAPPSDGSREGSRRSNFNLSVGGRSARVLSGVGGAPAPPNSCRAPSQELFTPTDLQLPERWRSRGSRNTAAAAVAGAGRKSSSQFSFVDQGASTRGGVDAAAPTTAGGSNSNLGGGGGSGPGRLGVCSGASERAIGMRGSLTRVATGHCSRSDVAAVSGGGKRSLLKSTGSARSVSSAPTPAQSDNSAAAAGPRRGGSPAPSRGAGATSPPCAGGGEGGEGSAAAVRRRMAKGEGGPPGGRAALLLRERARMGGFASAGDGGGGGGEGGDRDEAGVVSSSSCSSLLGEGRDSGRLDPAAPPPAAAPEATGGGTPAAACEGEDGGPCCSSSLVSCSPAAATAGSAVGAFEGTGDDSTKDVTGGEATSPGVKGERGGGGGSSSSSSGSSSNGLDNEKDGASAFRSVFKDGIRELGISDRTVGGGRSSSRRTLSRESEDGNAAGHGRHAGVGAPRPGDGGHRPGGGGGGGGRDETSPVLSPSAAPRSRQQHMLKARSSFEGNGSSTRDISAGASFNWSTNSPSPTTAEND